MAKSCTVCGVWCAYFLVFLQISAVLSLHEYYSYGPVVVNYDADLVQLGEGWRAKREVKTNPNDTIIVPATTQKPELSSVDVPAVVNRTLSGQKNTTSKTTKLLKPAKPSNLTVSTPKTLETPNENLLGANGTGQRKDVTTPMPITIVKTTTAAPNNATASNKTADSDEDIDLTVTKFNDEDDDSPAFNKTLSYHNITLTRIDSHIYYNSTLWTDPKMGQYFWVDLANRSDAKINELLSESHRRATTVKLSFEFPFYGHLIKNVTIATGGFLYTGDYVHSWLAATQYIAPLMANFDTSISNESFIRYADNGTAFTVEWEKVALQDDPDVGTFTFQTTLHKNGDIVFVYKTVPMFINKIGDEQHPVKVGLSDAYIIDRIIYFVRRKTIYEYHRVNFFKEDIKNYTVIYLTALPTCLQSTDCHTCVTRKIPTSQCQWCPTIGRCSNGYDRHRQDWLTKGCDKKQLNSENLCSHMTGSEIFDESNITYTHDSTEFEQQMGDYSKGGRGFAHPSALGHNHPVKMGVSGIVAILFLIAMMSGLAVWVLYAYRNPHTTSGQMLIRYRPSQWRWRRGEARYTAATIHM